MHIMKTCKLHQQGTHKEIVIRAPKDQRHNGKKDNMNKSISYVNNHTYINEDMIKKFGGPSPGT